MMKNSNNSSNRGRSKLFSCFKPAVVDDSVDTGKGRGGKENTVIPYNSTSDINDRNSKSSRRFKRLIKSVLFDIPLSKKLRNRKSSKSEDVYGSLKSYKFSNSKSSSFTETSDSDDTPRINSTRSSSIFSASTNSSFLSDASVSSSNSRSSSRRTGTGYVLDESNQFPKVENENQIFCPTIILSLFLMCLLALVFCGKLCAIFCTLTCFFLCSRQSSDSKSAVKSIEFPVNMNSKEHRKKMIMVGLLGRDRSRHMPYYKPYVEDGVVLKKGN